MPANFDHSMRLVLLAVPLCVLAQPSPDWTPWAVRPETAPKTARQGGQLLIDAAGNPAAYGGWTRTQPNITPGQWYRLSTSYRATGVPAENWQVVARIDWRDSSGKRTGQPEYAAWSRSLPGGSTHLEILAPAPPNAAQARIELLLANAPNGKLTWHDVSLSPAPAPAPRRVNVATLNLRPIDTGASATSVQAFVDAVNSRVTTPVDLIVLPEGISVVGTGIPYAQVAETLPGPTTKTLGQLARKHNAYIVAGLYERDANVLYNTAVLIDRKGNLAGKYRKVYLPREEIEAGLTPGAAYPVFDTDFGRLGIMICYDVFFPDPARALAAQGADVIVLPIWGGDETLATARAIENGVFLVASGYDHPTYIMDPNGRRIAWAPQRGEAAIATIDLARRYADPWLGDMRTRRLKELRLDVPTPPPGHLEPAMK